ncbi:MAG: hypothetical protein JO107_11590 [Hyphomicrobiales bacterium]|nr:hypothetical protein [Hyphomicrobiales bacterium]MBV8663735.1 hypothetical protein [Hyphomicrobiales bacterium]
MGVIFVLLVIALAIAGLALGAAVAIRAGRRALAAELIGEIAETLNLLETHDVERLLAEFGADGRLAPSLPLLPTVSYRTDAPHLALLGAHLARLSAGFYASAEALQDELRTLTSEANGAGRAERVHYASEDLRRTFELGDEALRSLRDIVSGRRHDLISRA